MPVREATVDRLQPLTTEECLDLLGHSSLGRVAFTERALPAIRPVNYVLVGHQLVLRTQADGLGRRLDGQVVAFEVDDIDAEHGTGWSIVVRGTARLLRSPGELMRQGTVPLMTLAGEGHDARVCIVPGEITGRRIRPAIDAA
jgi:nitroimidazol reductase NimA-like FMN-containing flavoprotein (pyridoxamine 5'-phosphate oxidase superfamily)